MYFKIKTTGLNPFKDSIYLVGWLDPESQDFHYLFLEDFAEEVAFLKDFLAQAPSSISSFRGGQFDLPFLNKKLESFQLDPYRPRQRDLWEVQENFSKFQDFPHRTRAGWQLYYTKSPGLSYKNEQKYLQSYYEDRDPQARKILIRALKEEIAWYGALDRDLKKIEKDFSILERYEIQSVRRLEDCLQVQGTSSLEDREVYRPSDWLRIQDGHFTYEILLNKAMLEGKEAYYLLCPPLKRLALRDKPLDDRVLVLIWDEHYFKDDILQVLKNRLQKLELL